MREVPAIRRLLPTSALALLLLVATALPAVAVDDVTPARVAGTNRVETAARIAGLAFPEGTATAIVADSTSFHGALVGSGLAGSLDAPVLLTRPDDLPDATSEALGQLGVQQVAIMGGEDRVGPAVAAQLDEVYDVVRYGGTDQYETAATAARATAAVVGDLPTVEGRPTVFLASGEDFPDALALSGPAHDGGFPLLLTPPDALSADAAAVLDELAPEQVVVAGGPVAVSDGVLNQIEARGILTTRLGGVNRTETATVIADFFVDVGYFQAVTPLLARGDEFADALTAGALSSVQDGPILLTATQGLLGEFTGNWFSTNCPTIEVLQVVGGEAAVSVEVANGAEGLAESCGTAPPPPPVTGQTYQVQPQQVLEGEAPTTFDFEVARRYDGQPFDPPLDLILFPCSAVDVVGSGPDTFTDIDDDGAADGFGATDTGQARIAVVNGQDIEDTTVTLAGPGADGDIDVRLASQGADCATLVVVKGDGDGELDLDDQNRPAEQYGVGQARWTE